MGQLFKRYKTKFRYNLQPLMALLVYKRKATGYAEWKELCHDTKLRIINKPLEYLGSDLPEQSLLRDIVDEIFSDFVKERDFHDEVSRRMN